MQMREHFFYLEDMLQSINKIEVYLSNLVFEDFVKNELVVDAVIRNFEIIGEAANNLSDGFYEKYPEIPWSKMYRLRNIVIHHYHGIDYEMIWEITHKHLPQNKLDLIKIIEKERIIEK